MKPIEIPKQDEESVFDLADGRIFESEKTAPTSSSGAVFPDSNLRSSALSKSRFFNLFGYRKLAIQLQVKKYVLGEFLGFYRSLFRGKGLEYDEIRKYVPGDDPKAFAWAKLAQLGEPYVKTFLDERDLTVLIAFDTSSSIFWKRPEKALLALEAASLLIFSAAISRDRVGLALFSQDVERFIPPRRGMTHAGKLVEALSAIDLSRRRTSMVDSLHAIGARRGPKRAVIFVISDFATSEPDWEKSLLSLANHNDLIAIQVVDAIDLSPPVLGWVCVSDPETGSVTLRNFSKSYVAQAQAVLEKNRSSFAHFASHHDIGRIELREGAVVAHRLREFFAQRCRQLKRG